MFRTMEIDFDVHKLIEAERRGFDDPPLSALRRLLGLGDAAPLLPSPKSSQSGRPWTDEGVMLPHGTLVKMKYGRHTYEGQILDGQWIIDGQVYDSPSGAAIGVARTKKGTTTHLNGWRYWQVKRAQDLTWTSLQALRREAEPRVKAEAEALLQKVGLLENSESH
jgi:hypothetical protein